MRQDEVHLGQQVVFHPDSELRRAWATVTTRDGQARQDGRKWQTYREMFGWPLRDIPEEGGIVVGTRTLQEGYSHYHGDGIDWVSTGTIQVVLVAVNLRHEPKKFLAESLTEAF